MDKTRKLVEELFNDCIIVKELPDENIKGGLIASASNQNQRIKKVEVIQLPSALSELYKTIEENDKLIIFYHAGTDVELQGEKYLFINPGSIICKL